MAELGPDVLNQVTVFDGANPVADSLLFVNLLTMWTKHLLGLKWFPSPSVAPSKRTRPLVRLHEFDADEFEVDGDGLVRDEDGMPHGQGVLKFVLSQDDFESCVGGECVPSLKKIYGKFDHGNLVGFAHLHYVNGDVLRGHFGRGNTLHGFAVKTDSGGRILSASDYQSGVRSGPSWQGVPDFGAFLHGSSDPADKGKVDPDGDPLLLYVYNNSDVFALGGRFDDGILQGQGVPRKLSKAWFEKGEGGVPVLRVEAKEEAMDFPEGQYRFKAGPNLLTQEERFLAQASWLYSQRYDQLEPKEAIRDPEKLAWQFRELVNVTQAMPTHEDAKCREYLMQDTGLEGSIRPRWLACYPGTGSKWLLKSIVLTTGLLTYGCVGPYTNYVENSGLLVKTHHQEPLGWQQSFSVLSKHNSKKWTRQKQSIKFRTQDIARLKGRAIMLVRNPYDNMITFWNHDRTNSYDGGPDKDGIKDLANSIQTDIFKEFVKTEIKMWEEIYLDYLTMGSELLLVNYEDMKEDMKKQLTRIMDFLNLPPAEEKRLQCVLTKKFDRIKRKGGHALEDPYDEDMRLAIESAIQKIQDMLKFRGMPPLPVERYRFRKPDVKVP